MYIVCIEMACEGSILQCAILGSEDLYYKRDLDKITIFTGRELNFITHTTISYYLPSGLANWDLLIFAC